MDTIITPYIFPEPLEEGVILARPNRFIMDVQLPEGVIRCHCPVVSRIGDISTEGRPCLVSTSSNPKRKFAKTVEALSLDEPATQSKHWIGINQTASNRYLEHFLGQGAFEEITSAVKQLRREVPCGSSRLDFLINDDLFVEVKTPLVQLQTPIPPSVDLLPATPFSSTERALRHIRELAQSLQAHQRAVILYCFYYDNPGFKFYHGTTYDEVRATVEACHTQGVELWQANFQFSPEGVQLDRTWQLEDW